MHDVGVARQDVKTHRNQKSHVTGWGFLCTHLVWLYASLPLFQQPAIMFALRQRGLASSVAAQLISPISVVTPKKLARKARASEDALARSPKSSKASSKKSANRLQQNEEAAPLVVLPSTVIFTQSTPSARKIAFTPAHDLNDRLQCSARRQECDVSNVANVTVMFEDISDRLCDIISHTPYLVGCMAWLSDKQILSAMEQCRGVSIVVTNDALLSLPSIAASYKRLTPVAATPKADEKHEAIRCLGSRTGRFRALMHHKFLVGLDDARAPVWVVTGSFNASNQAQRNIENAMVIRDARVAAVYHSEFIRVREASKAIAWRRATPRVASV